MGTIYNISLQVETINDKLVSPESAQKIVKIFDDAGLTGEKHVDEIGRVYDGYDSNCDLYDFGEYDIFVRLRPQTKNMNLREASEYLKLTNSDAYEMMAKEPRLEASIDVLEKANPLARDLTFDMYYQLPHVETFAIDTPVGKQDTHVHTTDGRIIQFWRPKNRETMYDFDTLRSYLIGVQFDVGELNQAQIWKRHKAYELYENIMSSPDDLKGYNFLTLWLMSKIKK